MARATAYVPSYTRQVMDRNHGAPVMAVHTRTDEQSKKVFVYPAQDPDSKAARKFRSDETMGPAYFAFGVPLRTLKLKLQPSRRLILPLNILEVPNQGIVYWASFADIEKEVRNVDAAAKQTKAAAKKKPAPTQK